MVPCSPLPRLLALAASALVLGGCTTSVVQRGVERRVEKRLTSVLGPADRYRCRILRTRSAELARGRVNRAEIEGTRVLARGQMLLERVRVTLDDLRYEDDPELLTIRRGDLEVEFTDDALNDYLRKLHPRQEPEFRFEAGRVHAAITYPFLGEPTRIRASGRLVMQEGRLLIFEADRVDVSFLRQEGFGERFVEDRVNPLLDLQQLDFPARLESVLVQEGRVRASGSASIRLGQGGAEVRPSRTASSR
ncbi:MAG: DUF2993 domain-containing protein [Armatimonadota bacterium]